MDIEIDLETFFEDKKSYQMIPDEVLKGLKGSVLPPRQLCEMMYNGARNIAENPKYHRNGQAAYLRMRTFDYMITHLDYSEVIQFPKWLFLFDMPRSYVKEFIEAHAKFGVPFVEVRHKKHLKEKDRLLLYLQILEVEDFLMGDY